VSKLDFPEEIENASGLTQIKKESIDKASLPIKMDFVSELFAQHRHPSDACDATRKRLGAFGRRLELSGSRC
jgi:hypothetical protein